jgi:hypothetical protein
VTPEPFTVRTVGAPRDRSEALSNQLEASLPAEGGTAIIADLDPVLGVHVAARLSERGLAYAVLVLPRWPCDDAILPTDEVVAALIVASRQLKSAVASNVVFVLDAERKRSIRNRPKSDPRADNRYDLALADLPNLKTLRDAGIQRVLKLSHQ